MKKPLISIAFTLFLFTAHAGNDFRPKGAATDALGGTSSTLINAFSIHNNQGAAAFMETAAFGLSYRSSFFPASVSEFGLTASGPVGIGSLGGSVEYFGNDLYHDVKIGLAYGMRLGDKIGLGVQLDYLQSKAQNYPGRHFVTFEVGLLYKPVESVSVGVHVFNPVKYKVDDDTGELLPIVFRAGVQYRPHEQISLYADVEKDIDRPFNFTGGIAYRVIDELEVRGGFSTRPAVVTFGLGYRLKDMLVIDAAGNYHLDLGFNTGISVSFLLKKKDGGGE